MHKNHSDYDSANVDIVHKGSFIFRLLARRANWILAYMSDFDSLSEEFLLLGDANSPRVTISPVTQVAMNIKAKGNHVPRKLRNISRLLLMIRATRKKSSTMTNPRNADAVTTGFV